MQPSIPWSISVSVFVIERMAIIHSLKCTVPFSFDVPLLSLAVTHCHLLSLDVTRRMTRCHSLSLVVPLVVICCHSLYHSLSLVVIRCHSLSLDVPLVCLFINDHIRVFHNLIFLFFLCYFTSNLFSCFTLWNQLHQNLGNNLVRDSLCFIYFDVIIRQWLKKCSS